LQTGRGRGEASPNPNKLRLRAAGGAREKTQSGVPDLAMRLPDASNYRRDPSLKGGFVCLCFQQLGRYVEFRRRVELSV
jgi:hypothetical protein